MTNGPNPPADGTRPASLDDTMMAADSVPRVMGSALLARGDTIGRYLVLEELGRGAMGVVYGAFDPELDRRLAIKLLHRQEGRGVDMSEGTTRLLREAQAMAKLTHTNVVTVHDVGTFQGAVFLAMEHLDDGTVGELMEKGAPWQDLLAIFIKAGRGLFAAHQAGLVHRDFKPDNVLLGKDGRVRVADFGLARARNSDELAERSPATDPPMDALEMRISTGSLSVLSSKLTATGALMGTPAYMAPEQYLGLPIDAKTDQFAFCVAVFEAVYGQRPFAGESVHSLAMAVTTGKLRTPTTDRGVPAWLRRVILRGLSKDPADRYPDMDALLRALDRDSRAKARRTWLLAGGVVVGLGLLGGGLVWRDHAQRAALCSGFSEDLDANWTPAAKDKIRQAFSDTKLSYADGSAERAITALDEYGSQWSAQSAASCQATTVAGTQSAELLDLRAACLSDGRRHMDALVEVLSTADEQAVKKAVDAVESLPSLSRCEDTKRLLSSVELPADEEQAKQVEEVRVELARSEAHRDAGRYKEALAIATAASEAAAGTGYRPLQAEAAFVLGAVAMSLSDLELAQTNLDAAMRGAIAVGDDRLAVRSTLYVLANVSAADTDHQLIEELNGIGLALIDRSGADDMETDLASNYVNALRRSGQVKRALEEAQALMARALELYGEDHVTTAHVRMNMMAAAWAAGNYTIAVENAEKAHETWRRELGEDHPRTSKALMNVGLGMFRQGKYPEAEEAARKVLELDRRVYGEGSLRYVSTLSNLGIIVAAQGRAAEAIKIQEEVLAGYIKHSGPDSADVGEVYANISMLYLQAGDPERAVSPATKGVELIAANLGSEHVSLLTGRTILGATLREVGRHEEALKEFEEARRVGEAALGPDSNALYNVWGELGMTYADMGRFRDAVEASERALALSVGEATEPGHFADMNFALARGVWGTARDAKARARAIELANLALTQYDDTPTAETRRAQVREWLRTRR